MSNVFEGAIGVIERRGWARAEIGQHVNDHGLPVCILGAVAEAKGMDANRWDAVMTSRGLEASEHRVLREIIQEQFPEYQHEGKTFVYCWNDDVATLEDVIMVLGKAAARVE